MAGYEPELGGPPPTPVIGMVVVGALLILIEGILEIGILNIGAAYGLPVPPSIWAVPAFTILLAVLLFILVWRYADEPSWGLGVVFIVLGILSFILGAGFLVGGVLVIIGGALACFADWVQQLVNEQLAFVKAPTTSPSASVRSAEPVSAPASSAAILVYRRCPSCGELNRRELTVCSSCGKPIDE
ncbi:MAG: zinc ribbon domain-containing protein [Thermoplasmata archaeon]|jgi:hypothetical protein